MSFLNSLPLWASLAAVGVCAPILIHLWSRSQKFETPWAAMELLRKALIARSQKIQVEDYLLLLLRCMAFLVIALALLRPVVNTSGLSSKGSRGVGVMIGIDASYSMEHGQHARFEKAIAKTREILSTLEEGEPVSIVLMSKHPQVLFRRTGYESEAFNRGLEELASASAHPLNLERNLQQLDELVAELKTPNRECYIITDSQTADWQGLSDQARSTLERICQKSHVVVAPVQIDGVENLAITDFSYDSGSLQSDRLVRFTTSVRNLGNKPVDGASIEFFVNNKPKPSENIGRIAPGETRSVPFLTSFESLGDIALTARLSKDDLLDDNERHTIVRVQSSMRVLCIDGDFAESSAGTPRGGYYAVRALRLKNLGENAPIKVVHIDASDWFSEKLNDYDLVVMINVPNISSDFGRHLHQFTSGGGGLLIFLGDRVDPEKYNRHLLDEEHPVLPAKLVEIVEHADLKVGWQIITPESDHLLAKVIARLPVGLMAEARVDRVVRAIPLKGTETILELDDSSLPLLLQHRSEQAGRVVVCTSSADRSWNNFPVHPLLSILLQQSATMLSRSAQVDQGIVGEPAIVPLEGRMMGDEVVFTDPQGESISAKATLVKGKTVCQITPTMPGVYRAAAQSGHPTTAVAANVDVVESDVRAADSRTLEQRLQDIPLEVVTDGLADAALNHRTGRDLGLWLLSAGIFCFITQGLLANRWSRRKYADADGGGVAASLQGHRVAASRRS